MHALCLLLLVAGLACAADPPGRPAPQKPADETVLFGDLPTVEAASLHAQTLAEAPASVTVITAAEIRRYGYRTLAEVLDYVRGFYVTYDHQYHYTGVAGLSLPGDFNTRFLVMLNGHPLTDNIYNANNFFGQDFGLDLELVERIEIIRGPTSALYGSNGMLANINVVTRSPVDGEKLVAAAETSSDGDRKVSLASSVYLGRGANLLVSASAFNNRGLEFDVDGLSMPAGVRSPVDNADGERGYHTFANLIWHDWSVMACFNNREKRFPVGIGGSYSGDASQGVSDSRNLIAATYKRKAGSGDLRWQIAFDQYRYRDRFDYPTDDGVEILHDVNLGDWMDSKLTYEVPVPRIGLLTMGLDGAWEFRNRQYNVDAGVIEDIVGRPDRTVALFAQQEWNLSAKWKLHAGVRFDDSRNFHRFVSPRLAAVYQSTPRTSYKLVYGRPFRNPSAFEQFYNDGGLSYGRAPLLHPETAHTFEASVERRLSGGFTVIGNGFHYRIGDVVEAVALDAGVLQYRNTGVNRSTGIGLEFSGKFWKRLETAGSVVLQTSSGGPELAWLPNSPHRIAKFRLGVPLGRERLFLSAGVHYVSARTAWTGDRLGGAPIADATATVRLNSRFEIQGGLRNILDKRYEDPIYLTVDRLRGDGRCAFVRLVLRAWE
ncbi:MAG TPA: TonB-dependent receptor [Bryobacteraceae bacterium]